MFFEGAAAASTAPTPGAAAATPATTTSDPARAAAGRDPGAGRRRRPRPRRAAGSGGDPGPGRHDPRPPRPPRRRTVTKNKTLLIAVVAAAAATAAFWFLALAPKREEAASLEAKIAAKQTELETAAADAGRLPEGSKADYGKNYASVVRLGKAVPEDDDVRSLLVQLDAEAGGTRRRLPHGQIGGTGAGRRGDRRRRRDGHARRRPAPSPSAPPGFSAMPFTFSFRGSFGNLSQLLRPHGALRDAAQRAAERHGSPAAARDASTCRSTQTGFPNIRAQIGANSYLVPETQGLTAGGDRAGPGRRDARGDPGSRRRLRRPDDHRDRDRSHPMKPLENVWSGLVQRRLLPVAILLVGRARRDPVPARQGPEPVAGAGARRATSGATAEPPSPTRSSSSPTPARRGAAAPSRARRPQEPVRARRGAEGHGDGERRRPWASELDRRRTGGADKPAGGHRRQRSGGLRAGRPPATPGRRRPPEPKPAPTYEPTR